MKKKTLQLCKRGLALLFAAVLCVSLLPGMAMAVEAAPSKTISASIKFYNHTGKRITELYFEESGAEDYGEEYLAVRGFRYWSNNRYIMVPLEFTKNAALDFFIRYSDGTGYEAKGLKLAKATASGSVIDLRKTQVSLKVRNIKTASVKFVKEEDATPRVTGVRLNKTAATLTAGQTMKLTATVSPAGADKKVTWASSNVSVATVNSSGRVTGVKAGRAKITARTADGGFTASCQVTVTEETVNASVDFYNHTNKRITELYFESSDAADYGEEYLAASGLTGWGNKTTIKVPLTFERETAIDLYIRCADGTEYEARGLELTEALADGSKIELTLSQATLSVNGRIVASAAFSKKKSSNQITSVKLNKTSLSLNIGGAGYLRATVSPSSADAKVTWASSDPSVASVSSSGKVTGIKAGTATITATTVDGGHTASCKVTVAAKTISASINFYNRTGKQINELYFEESGNSSWDEEYLATQNFRYWTNGKYIQVPLKFTTDASLDFYIRCKDGSAYEARGLSLEKAKVFGTKIEFTASAVSLFVDGVVVSTATFVQKEAPAPVARTINVKFVNGTTADFTNFTARPQGGAGSSPETLKANFGETTLQFTVADDVSVFEINFVESVNNQPYTMAVTFDSSVKDGGMLTVQFNVDEATQQIVYSQI